MKNQFNKILFVFVVIIAACGFSLAQSPTLLRARCPSPNANTYSIVQIAGIGDINVQPCPNRTTIFTGAVSLPTIAALSLANGSAAAPSLYFANSPTTGLYRSAADVLGIATAAGANTTFGATLNTYRSTEHIFTNTAGTAQFNVDLVPSDTVGTLNLGDCVTTATTCVTLTQSSDTVAIGGGTGTTLNLAGTKSVGLQRTITAAGTTGAQTINKQAGTVNFAAGAAAIVVTNSTVTASSIITTNIRFADATCTFVKSSVPTSGSFTITLNANCTAETSVGFVVWN